MPILFYRMGDFYEMFFEDAEIASKVLGITLTSRSSKSDVATGCQCVEFPTTRRHPIWQNW